MWLCAGSTRTYVRYSLLLFVVLAGEDSPGSLSLTVVPVRSSADASREVAVLYMMLRFYPDQITVRA